MVDNLVEAGLHKYNLLASRIFSSFIMNTSGDKNRILAFYV